MTVAVTQTDAPLQFEWNVPTSNTLYAIERSRVATRLVSRVEERIGAKLRDRMREIIRDSLAGGLHPTQTARLLYAEAERALKAAEYQLLRVARTEQADAYRAAAKVTQEANADVLRGWLWVCSLSANTCPGCIAMHGTEHPLSEPGPDDHPNGGCQRIPRVRPWSELGFDDADQPDLGIRDAQEWFGSLSANAQEAILGPGRFAAWAEGRYPMSDWVQERPAPRGWRRSFQPTPVPS